MASTCGKLLVVALFVLLVPFFRFDGGANRAAAEPAAGIRRASVVPAEVFQGRMRRSSSSNLVVVLERYGGDVVRVNGEDVSLGDSGIELNRSDHIITFEGADVGVGMASETLYYVYLSNSSASTFPSDLRGSMSAPTLVNGIKYLGASGNAANWRFVGWVYADVNISFQDNLTERWVINYYNRRPLFFHNFATADSWTYNTQLWRRWQGQDFHRVSFISNGEDAVFLTFTCFAANSGGSACFVSAGIGLDSVTQPAASSTFAGAATWNWVHVALTATYSGVPSEGPHFLQLLEISENVGTTYWKGDDGRSFILPGATGFVMG